jgi:hypothetical protein
LLSVARGVKNDFPPLCADQVYHLRSGGLSRALELLAQHRLERLWPDGRGGIAGSFK